jgi:hypothetical protein
MRRFLAAVSVATAMGAGGASADEVCGALTHMRYGETRAYFQDVLAACRPDGYCSVVGEVADPTRQSAFRQQFRIARPAPGAPHEVQFAATDPMPVSGPMQLSFASTAFDLSDTSAMTGSVNEFRVTDRAMADSVVTELKRARTARWTYAAGAGPASATFPLNGLRDALTWIDCVGVRP